ncbi:MAG: phenylalanine--tRNA ligase subunit alpha [Clostridia bacterium]|nr:phenylalanine--tRNA ligase subunit alpha [Clostridia bacterium]
MTTLDSIKTEALSALEKVTSTDELSELSVSVLGKKGSLTAILRTMGQMTPEERAATGKQANIIKAELEKAFEEKKSALSAAEQERMFLSEAVDVTAPGNKILPRGRLHPMTQTYREIRDALIGLGFTMFDGPEIEYDDYCFTKLNLPPDHPARDMQDTFYINDKVLLRTHTSPCEVRAMLNLKPPFRLVIPGRVFRVDEVDASHSPVFMQMEGLVVDKEINMQNLKGTLLEFVHAVFGENVDIRMRPSYFPFTEPSAEVDISCTICGGKGHVDGKPCRICKGTGWIEVLGCGMSNPHILENCGLDSKEWSAFAFGIGVDRVTSLKYSINDIRHEYENDARFLNQF